MSLRSTPLAACAIAAAAALCAPRDARACGGCFHPENQSETTVVTAHRMAFAMSPTHTVLWDQIEYAGRPAEFAWVLPVMPGAVLELSNDAWFETLDAATSTRVVGPQLNCSSFGSGGDGFDDGGYYWDEGGGSSGCNAGCGSLSEAGGTGDYYGTGGAGVGAGTSTGTGGPMATPPPPVVVVHQGTVGPYETVTLHANVPNALPDWLTSHGYAIDADIDPIITAYVSEGFDFIALRLLPDQGVQQMKPVRVVTPGMSPTLPLRMVAAGTGANVSITLFVIGEGRWQAQNFPNGQIDRSMLSWDFNTNDSSYAEQRQALLATDDGRTWNNAYAKQGAFLSPQVNPLTPSTPVQYTVGMTTQQTIGWAYVAQGIQNGETQSQSCGEAFDTYATSLDLVVEQCSTGTGGSGGAGTGGSSGGAGGASAGGGGAGGAGTGAGGAGAGGGAPCAPGSGEIAASEFACGTLDDVAVALTGLHPRDVWLTRLEANLPRAALADDLTVEASPSQLPIENWLQATKATNAPCPLATAAPPTPPHRADRRKRNQAALAAAALLAIAAALARRAGRRPVLLARPLARRTS